MWVRGDGPAQLGGEGMAALGDDPLLGILQSDVGLGKIEHAAESVVEGGGEIVGELALQHDAQAVGVESVAGIAEGAGRNVGQKESAGRRDFAGAE